MKLIKRTLLIAGLTSVMLCSSAFANEVQAVNETQIEFQVNTEEQETNKKGIVTVDILNVRSGPSTDTEKLGKLSLGANVEILSEAEGWYEINFESNTAYICAEYVKIIDSTLTVTQNIGLNIVDYAKLYIGTPYAYGGNTPAGFDCSGFIQYVMSNFGVTMPRSSTEQYSIGVRVEKSELLPGDLVYFKYNANSYRLSHVGIYVGDGNFIHSPVPGQTVKISSLTTGYFSNYYYGATRVLK